MIAPHTFVSIIGQLLPEPHASLLSGMIFGGKATMPPDFYDALKKTGTLHIIALSGANISIIINVLGTIFIVFGRRVSSLLTIVWICLFVWFVGPSANVIRAAIMGGLTLIGVYVGRQRTSLLSLFFTVIIMLTIFPAWIFDIGFQLSFLATLGIIVLGGGGAFARYVMVADESKGRNIFPIGFFSFFTSSRFYRIFNTRFGVLDSILGAMLVDFRTTLAAQLFTFPVIVYHFHQISLVSPLTNVLVGWIVQPITVLGLLIAFLGWIFFPIGQLLALFMYPMLDYFISVVIWTGKLPFASYAF